MKDYYSILGVSRDADQEEIKRAYRRLARRYHPDVNKGDREAEERFKEITEAYEVLGDEEKRRRYDLQGSGMGLSAFMEDFADFTSPFGGIFDMFFGRPSRASRQAPRRGSDLVMEVEIDLEEAYRGEEREVEIPRMSSCPQCGGSGLERGYDLDLCPECGGDGNITYTRRSAFGTLTTTTTCRRCGGTGGINTHPCPACGGRGMTKVVDRIQVTIPPGVKTGDRIRIPGRGEAGERGGPPGDLYVEVVVREHPLFRREGDHLFAEVEVGMAEAALGTELTIPTLEGEEKIKLPPGSQPGDTLRIKGKGMPRINSRAKGDLFLTLEVRIPRNITPEQRRLLEEFRRLEREKVGGKGFIGKLKRAMRS